MHIVVVDVGKEVAAGYEKEGQYLQMKVGDDGKPAYLAIACAREAAKDGQLEFLIKNIPDSNHADIIGLGEGSEVRCASLDCIQVQHCQQAHSYMQASLFSTMLPSCDINRQAILHAVVQRAYDSIPGTQMQGV